MGHTNIDRYTCKGCGKKKDVVTDERRQAPWPDGWQRVRAQFERPRPPNPQERTPLGNEIDLVYRSDMACSLDCACRALELLTRELESQLRTNTTGLSAPTNPKVAMPPPMPPTTTPTPTE